MGATPNPLSTGICRLRIDPSEIGSLTTLSAQRARAADVRRRLIHGRQPQHDAHVAAWRQYTAAPWLRLEYAAPGWPVTAPGWVTIQPMAIEDPERDQPPPPTRILIRDIIAVVAAHYGVSVMEMLSQRRRQELLQPRHIAMYLAHVLTPRSLPEIGAAFQGRDHTTVLSAVRKIKRHMALDPDLAAEVEALRSRITGGEA